MFDKWLCLQLSWADLFFAANSEHMSLMLGSDVTQGYPNMQALQERVYSLPRVQTWLQKRPQDVLPKTFTEFFEPASYTVAHQKEEDNETH